MTSTAAVVALLIALGLAACRADPLPATATDAGAISVDAAAGSVDAAAGGVDAAVTSHDDAGCAADACPGSGPLPACAWPVSLEPTDAGDGRCHAARSFLSCQESTGGTAFCLTGGPGPCPDPSVQPGVTYACENLCKRDEYAIACGSVGPGPSVAPPDGCTAALLTPAGVGFYCCPCASPSR